MPHSDDKLKARMMARAEAAIAAMLAERSKKSELDLGDIEHLAREVGQRVMQEITAGLAEAEAEMEEATNCPECGQVLRYKGTKGRNLVTDTGEVHIERGYYYCPSCRKGLFPPRPPVGCEQDDL
jgi:uncharacterized protein with PIN domain